MEKKFGQNIGLALSIEAFIEGLGGKLFQIIQQEVVFLQKVCFKCTITVLFQQLKQMTMWLSQNPTAFSPFTFPYYQNYYPSFPTVELQASWSPISYTTPIQPTEYMHRTIIVIQQGGAKQALSVEETTKQSVQNKNQCPHCHKVFKFRIQYFRHLSDRYKHCQQKFGSEYIPQRVPKKPKIYACKQCSRSYTQKSALRRHKKNKKHR